MVLLPTCVLLAVVHFTMLDMPEYCLLLLDYMVSQLAFAFPKQSCLSNAHRVPAEPPQQPQQHSNTTQLTAANLDAQASASVPSTPSQRTTPGLPGPGPASVVSTSIPSPGAGSPGMAALNSPSGLPLDGASTPNGTTAGGSDRAGSELVIQVPSVVGELDSWQFGVLENVITNIFAYPLPQVGPGLLRCGLGILAGQVSRAGITP